MELFLCCWRTPFGRGARVTQSEKEEREKEEEDVLSSDVLLFIHKK